MPRLALIFGNGLGMALDSQYFALPSGLRSVWNGSEHFREEHKRLVTSAIQGLSAEAHPELEEQLDQLQVAIVASEFLRRFESENVKWLSDHSREFPQAFRRFVHEVASYFHDSGKHLPYPFVDSLSNFIKVTKSHVAVLNYDNLLYDALTETGVLSGYNGSLIDGFHRVGFDKKNLDRNDLTRLGWYLHLHGSPLFVGNRKLMRDERAFVIPNESSHIVLTHVEHKPLVIASSQILTEYWSRLSKALTEAEKVVLFGYSGCDVHLNEVVAQSCIAKEIHIFEWSGAGQRDARDRFWHEKLHQCPITLHQFENLLAFEDWHAL
jgi:hypothetical protein